MVMFFGKKIHIDPADNNSVLKGQMLGAVSKYFRNKCTYDEPFIIEESKLIIVCDLVNLLNRIDMLTEIGIITDKLESDLTVVSGYFPEYTFYPRFKDSQMIYESAGCSITLFTKNGKAFPTGAFLQFEVKR